MYIMNGPATCWYQPQGDHLAQDFAATDAACLLLTPLANQSTPAKSKSMSINQSITVNTDLSHAATCLGVADSS